MAPRQGAKKLSSALNACARQAKLYKLANNIIAANNQARLKSLITRDSKKDACTLRDPLLGLTLLQIAVIADNVPAVEELIALGADVDVTVSEQRTERWTPQDLSSKLSQLGAQQFWQRKIVNMCNLRSASESVQDSLFGLIHLAVFAGSNDALRFLVNHGYTDVNAPAAYSGLTPLMCVVLCRTGADRETGGISSMLETFDVLLELGGNVSRVNVVGNDLVAIAASVRDNGMWAMFKRDPVLLSTCSARHAGRVALQLLASCSCSSMTAKDASALAKDGGISKVWCAEMTEMAAVWKAADARASERLVAELSEPVKQRVVQRGPDGANWDAFLDFWPDAHTTTNVLCAIMQCVGIPPTNVLLSGQDAHTMLMHLFRMGVQPKALLLPKGPDQGRCKLCQPNSLAALVDCLLVVCDRELSQHKEVLVDQLWCFFYTAAKHPATGLQEHLSQDVSHVRQFLRQLRKHGVDWTDSSAWPEDYVDGRWERQIPISFLLENHSSSTSEITLTIVIAICQELAALGNTEFVNTHYPGRTSPLVHAARQGHSFVVMQMILCGGNPKRQGSDWVEFFAAATVTFRRDMAQTIHLMLNLPFLRGVIPVFQGGRHRGQVGGLQVSSLQPQESFIRHLTGGHPGYEALLQPLLDTTSRPEQLLYKQCQLALTAPKADMGFLLETFLNPGGELSTEPYKLAAAVLQLRDPKTGVTLLGQAVAWGYDEAVPPILDAVRKQNVVLAPILECNLEESKFHKPVFAAVVYGYESIVSSLLRRLRFQQELPAALLEHVVLGETGSSSGALPAQSCRFVAKPGRGIETIDLLMCAASVGSASTTEILLTCGVDPQDTQQFRRNRYYKTAMHAAVEYPDLGMLMWDGGKPGSQGIDSNGSLLPGTKQMQCVNLLLKAGAAMTEGQLTIITQALPALLDPKVARVTWRLLTRHVSACARCGLLGCWPRCQRCETTAYCSVKCQGKD